MSEPDREVIDFYKSSYYHSLADRESIQARIRLYVFISISTFIFTFFLGEGGMEQVYFFKINLNSLVSAFIVLVHVIILPCLFFIFKAHEYLELPDPKLIESHRKAKIDKGHLVNMNDRIIDLYAETSSHNMELNKKRRDMLADVVVLYFLVGFACFIWVFIKAFMSNGMT